MLITYIFFGSNYSWKKVHQFLHCMSTQKVHRSIVKMIVKFQLITVRSTTLDVFYCYFLQPGHNACLTRSVVVWREALLQYHALNSARQASTAALGLQKRLQQTEVSGGARFFFSSSLVTRHCPFYQHANSAMLLNGGQCITQCHFFRQFLGQRRQGYSSLHDLIMLLLD